MVLGQDSGLPCSHLKVTGPPGRVAAILCSYAPQSMAVLLFLQLVLKRVGVYKGIISRSCIQGGDIGQKNIKEKTWAVDVLCHIEATDSSYSRTTEVGEVDQVPSPLSSPYLENRDKHGHLAVTTNSQRLAHGKYCFIRWRLCSWCD